MPGGIGVSEAGLTLGLTAAGVSSETAFAIALAYRFVSFYLPPIWGWFCYQLARRQALPLTPHLGGIRIRAGFVPDSGTNPAQVRIPPG